MLQQLHEDMAGEPVTVLAVNCFERVSGAALHKAVGEIVEDLQLTMPVPLDLTGEVARRWGVEGIPATFVIDPQGRIAAAHTGAGPDYLETLRADVVEALTPTR